MSYTDLAIRAIILHTWEDAREWASALTALSDVTEGQLDERLRRAVVSPSEVLQGSQWAAKANGR